MGSREDRNVKKSMDIKEEGKTDAKEKYFLEENLKFQEKHKDFLSQLKDMPLRTKEDKKARWDFFQVYSARDEFVIGVWMASHPKAYEKLCIQLEKNYSSSFQQDAGMASIEKKKEIDPVIFQEAIKKAIETYTGRTQKGDEYVFIACVGQKYRQMVSAEANKNTMEKSTGVTIPRGKNKEFYRFIKAVVKAHEVLFHHDDKSVQSLKETMEYVLAGSKEYEITKKDRDFLIKYMMKMNNMLFLEEKINREENHTWGDVIADEKDDYQAVMNGVVSFLQDIEDKWEDIRAFGVKTSVKCKMFLTKDVLLVLKTDGKNQPYKEEPARNEEVYRCFGPQGRFLYERVFYEKYLLRAFMEKPEDFDETSVKILRDDFNFSDELLAEIEGKDKGTISRYRKVYKECMRFFRQ